MSVVTAAQVTECKCFMGGDKDTKVSLIAATPANEDSQDLEKDSQPGAVPINGPNFRFAPISTELLPWHEMT
jgi:hypothetical protein